MDETKFEFIEPKEEIEIDNLNISNITSDSTKCGDIFFIKNKEFTLTCLLCTKDFKTLKGFSDHYIKQHIKEQEENVNEDFKYHVDILIDSTVTSSPSTGQNYDDIKISTTFDNDKATHSDTDGDRIKLENCEIEIFQSEKIQTHNLNKKKRKNFTTNRNLKTEFVCETCGRKCPNQSYLMRHVSSHMANSDRPFKCQYCPKAFNYRNHLNRHETLHTKEPVLECDYCYMKFARTDNKKIHELQHTDEDKEQVIKFGKKLAGLSKIKNITAHEIQNELDDSVPDGYWRCKICEKILKNTYKQEDHQRLHTGEKPFICDICGKGMISQTLLNHHLLVHKQDRRYKCSQCPAGFYSSGHLKRHEISHSAEKQYKCEICGMGFRRKEHLTSHILTHDKNRTKNYKCDICTNSYYDSNALRIHKKKHLANTDGPFMCTICPAGFQLKEALKRHEKRHANKGMYKCDYCERRFNDKDDKNQHEKRCHLTTRNDKQQKLFECNQCDMKFMKKSILEQHYNYHQDDGYNMKNENIELTQHNQEDT